VLDLSFVPDPWWPLVTGLKSRSKRPARVTRRFLELCLVSQVANELKSCDLCLPSGDKFRDHRLQLVPWEEYEREVVNYAPPDQRSDMEATVSTTRKSTEMPP